MKKNYESQKKMNKGCLNEKVIKMMKNKKKVYNEFHVHKLFFFCHRNIKLSIYFLS